LNPKFISPVPHHRCNGDISGAEDKEGNNRSIGESLVEFRPFMTVKSDEYCERSGEQALGTNISGFEDLLHLKDQP